MKTSVISEEFRARYLSNPKDPEAFEGRAVVFDGPEDYHARIDDPSLEIDELVVVHARHGPRSAIQARRKVVNMRPPVNLIKAGIHNLPCIGDGGRQEEVQPSGSPSILNASPEAAVGGGLALLKSGRSCTASICARAKRIILISEEEMNQRRQALKDAGGFPYPASQTPWRKCNALTSVRPRRARCSSRQ